MRPIDADAFFENITGYAPPEMTWDAGTIHEKTYLAACDLAELILKGE